MARQTSYGYRVRGGSRLAGLDGPVVAAGGLLSGGLAVGLAALLGSSAKTGSEGATSAALDQAFSQLLGAAVGLAIGTAAVALTVRGGPRHPSGLLAGLVGFTCVLGPVFLATKPVDVSLGDAFFAALFLALLLIPAMVVGAFVGALVRPKARRVGP